MSTSRLRTAVLEYFSVLKSYFAQAVGTAYDGTFVTTNTGDFTLVSEPIVRSLNIVDNDDDLGYTKTTLQSNEYIFNNWQKISRGSWPDENPTKAEVGYSDTAIPSELDGFTYDSATDTISNDLDTRSMVGFVSPEGYEDYVLDVTLKSDSDYQNDPIGLLVGYARDSDGTTHTLTVFRQLRSSIAGDKALEIAVDLNTIGKVNIADTSTDLVWSDGSAATGPAPGWSGDDEPPGSTDGMWSDAYPDGVRLRITREGDDFTVETSNLGSDTIVNGATLTFSLDDDPSLARFKGPSPYGYVSISQDNAIWEASQRPGNAPTVIDIRNGEKHEWTDGSWSITSLDMDEVLPPGRMCFSPVSRKVFHRGVNGLTHQLLTTS